MKKEVIDYGVTVTAERYKRCIAMHEYIAQADAAVEDVIRKFCLERKGTTRVLDLGCGPDRLTSRIAQIPRTHITGLDYSRAFIKVARNGSPPANVKFIQKDFLGYRPRRKFDVIFMEGVWHHVPVPDRKRWLKKIHSILSPGGIVILGDEVIPKYQTEQERRALVGLFYLHIIGDAIEIRDYELAEDECINFLSDTLDRSIAGFYDKGLIQYLQRHATNMNNRLFTFDESKRLTAEIAAEQMFEIIREVEIRSRVIKRSVHAKRLERGDHKVSIPVLWDEFSESGFCGREQRRVGPVDYVGGMGVLTFQKK